MSKHQRIYIDALQEAKIFLDGPVTEFLSDFMSTQEFSNVRKGKSGRTEGLQLTLALENWINKLIAFAKQDLGLTARR